MTKLLEAVNAFNGDAFEKMYGSLIHFLAPQSLEDVYKILVSEAVNSIGGRYGAIFVYEKDQLEKKFSDLPRKMDMVPKKRGNLFRTFQQGKPEIFTREHLQKTHPDIHADFRTSLAIPLTYDGKSQGVIAVVFTIERDFTPHELHTMQLYGALASLILRKTQLHHETVQALQTRDLFISLASHELRTPLTTIYGYLQLMQNKIHHHQKFPNEWISTALHETEQLKTIVNELLGLNQVKSGNLSYKIEQIPFRVIIQRAISDFSSRHPHRTISFHDSIGEKTDVISADFDKIFLVILNILENSEKFSNRNTEITVRLTYQYPNLVLGIQDKGKGISKNDLKHLFKEFYKENDFSEGLGLGLYICKKIIKEHSGNIRVHSIEGEGTTVEILLPRMKDEKRV